MSAWRRVLTPKGTFIAVGVRPGGRWIGPLPYLLKVLASAPFVSQRVVFFVAKGSPDDLVALTQLIEANKLTPVIDRCYPLSEAPEAIRYLKEGHPRGKVVITVGVSEAA